MIWGLLRKELRQHGWAFVLVCVLSAAGAVLLFKDHLENRVGGSPFESFRRFLWTFVPLASLILGQTLIAGEYRHKTQLFLEGLPLSRSVMMAVKYTLGLLILTGLSVVLLAVAWHRSHGVDAVTPRFLALLLLRSTCWVWFFWSLCFAHGFTGRYRFLFGAVALLAFVQPLVFENIDFGAYGPTELAGMSFAYERYTVPFKELAVTSAYAVLWTGVGFMLGQARDASIATALAQPMSSREKGVLIFSAFAFILLAANRAENSERHEPVHIPGSSDSVRGPASVSVVSAVHPLSGEEREALQRYAALVSDELAAVAEFLRIEKMPPIFLVHRPDLEPGDFEAGELYEEQGLMVRANLTSPEFQPDVLVRWLVPEALITKSLGRLTLDGNSWVLDGFTGWWRDRSSPAGASQERVRRAAEVMPPDFSVEHLLQWNALHEDVGAEAAESLAGEGVRRLVERHGMEKSRLFLASVLGASVKRNAWPWLRDRLRPVSARFSATTRESLDSFTAAWRASLVDAQTNRPTNEQP